MTTLLVFLFAVVLMAVDGADAGHTLYAIGIVLIILNINVVCVSILSMLVQVKSIVLKVQREEKLSKLQVVPVLSKVRSSHRQVPEGAYCVALQLGIVVKIPLHNWTGHLLGTETQRLADELGVSRVGLEL